MKQKRLLTMLCLIMVFVGGCAYAQELEQGTTPVWTYPVSPSELQKEYIRLVNKESLLPSDYVPEDLVKIKVKKTSSTAIQMCQFVSDALDQMFAAALEDGITLYAHSGYRSYRTQNTMYKNRLEQNNGKDDGVVAYPGASDHQTGLGIDVISKAWIGKKFNAEFAKTAEAKWMAENCPDYGFVIRYPQGKEDITNIIYEPWHLRYVGVEAAKYMTANGLTLEEFTLEWQQVMLEYEANGGNAAQVFSVTVPSGTESEQPQSQSTSSSGAVTLDEVGEDGDPEVSLFGY